MQMQGEQEVPLGRDEAWQALNDPKVLQACIPGCESMEQSGEDEFRARVKTAVGPVKAQFKGKIKLADIQPPESYKMSFKGDGTAGFAQGTATVALTPSASGQGTTISYEAEAKVGGKLAQIGSRLIDGAARKMANEFFTNLTEHMGGTATSAGEDAGKDAPAQASAATAAAGEPASKPAAADEDGGLLAAIKRFLAKLFG